jgi:hypothetical protein
MQESVREWTPTFSLWELESQQSPKSSKNECRGQNSLNSKVHSTIGIFLERRCLKWALMTHLGSYNISYGQKKGWESNCQFDSRPLKVRNHPDFLACRWRATYHWKALDEGLQLCFIPHINQRSKHKIMGLQSLKSHNFENFTIPTWESRDKMTFGCWPRGQA